MAPSSAGVARTKRMPAVTSRHVAVARSVTTCAVPIAAGSAAMKIALTAVAAITAMYGDRVADRLQPARQRRTGDRRRSAT